MLRNAFFFRLINTEVFKNTQLPQICRAQWPSGLRHELSSPSCTLGSWVRIPLKAWMSVCVYSVCVVLCVGSVLASG
jgi:hypothetical protein